MRLFWLQSGFQSGVYNMALDEALLEWVRGQAQPILIVRTYCWECPTVSLGVNQPVRDLPALLERYGDAKAVVRRPTGGRAILHGEDVSFSFAANEPKLLKQSLRDSYSVFSGLVEQALQGLALPVTQSSDAKNRDYTRSSLCFETKTPSDLLAANGRKLSGSAQLRRAGGILQHGAAFLQPYGITPQAFAERLFEAAAIFVRAEPEPFPIDRLQPLFEGLEADYRRVSGEMLESASTTNGSHCLPASC